MLKEEGVDRSRGWGEDVTDPSKTESCLFSNKSERDDTRRKTRTFNLCLLVGSSSVKTC